MAARFLETTKAHFTTTFIQQLAISLDESDEGINATLNGLIPVDTAAILHYAQQGKDEAQKVFDLTQYYADQFPIPQDLANLTNEEVESVLRNLIGEHEYKAEHAVSKYAGTKHLSGEKLNLMLLPILMGNMGKDVRENNWDAEGLKQHMDSNKDAILSSVPEELRAVAGMYGLGSQTVDPKHIQEAVSPAYAKNQNKLWWLVWVLAILAVALLIFLGRGCKEEIHKRDVASISHEITAGASSFLLANDIRAKENIQRLC